MASDYSKYCSDHLREWNPEIKASHARELVAAFFGYKSHAALLAEKKYDIDYVDIAAVIIPDYDTIDERRRCLNGLPESIPDSHTLVDGLLQYLRDSDMFTGEVWDHDDLAEFMIKTYLPDRLESFDFEDELKDEFSQANGVFWFVEYESADVEENDKHVNITVSGVCYLSQDKDDKPFGGDTIDLEVIVELQRVAGRIAFEEPEITITETVNAEGLEEMAVTLS